MANVIMNVYKGQRMDITAQMRDADAILEVFRVNNVKFDKKYTSLNGKGPSTITFKGLKAENIHSDLTKMIVMLDKMADEDAIGNVYVKLTSFIKAQDRTPEDLKRAEELRLKRGVEQAKEDLENIIRAGDIARMDDDPASIIGTL